jgi:hypothetical protein
LHYEPVLHQVNAGSKSLTEFPPETEDYAEGRKKFKTRLLRQGPAPQKWEVVRPPRGVREIPYDSGSLHLKAWVSTSLPLPEPGRGPWGEVEKKPGVLFLHGGSLLTRLIGNKQSRFAMPAMWS